MPKYALYGSMQNNQASSKKSSKSNAFNIKPQKAKFSNKVTPLKESELNSNSKKVTTPSNAYLNYSLTDNESIVDIRSKLMKTLSVTEKTAHNTFIDYTKFYNRFKLPTLNDALQKGYAHVFFTRPDCNILNDLGTGLNPSYDDDSEFSYVWKNSPDVIKQLSLANGQSHQFMLSLSNKAASFSTSDESIEASTYGTSFKGWKIAYGRNNVESKTAGNFNISYNDDRTLHIYQIHRLWVDYISEVYVGSKAPREEYIKDKCLDYASSCYYIITAEDGETIIFWSKYYGVFPTTIPSNSFSWAYGSLIENQKYDVNYQYSFKEDMNPAALTEFNMNANIGNSMSYVPIYDKKLGHAGTTWVGAPYIEVVTNNSEPECQFTFKLRFRTPDEDIYKNDNNIR